MLSSISRALRAAAAPRPLSRAAAVASWTFQVIAAAILAQTLFFKFTGADEARFIFSTLGVEPWGRYATGTLELTAVLLVLTPRTILFGAGLVVGLMIGAVGAHLGPLGIEVQDDGGLLFGLAVVSLGAGISILALRRTQVRAAVGAFRNRETDRHVREPASDPRARG